MMLESFAMNYHLDYVNQVAFMSSGARQKFVQICVFSLDLQCPYELCTTCLGAILVKKRGIILLDYYVCVQCSASPGHTPSCVNLCCCSLTLLVIIYVVVLVIICSIACVLIRVTCLICVIIESLIFDSTGASMLDCSLYLHLV